MTRILFVSAAAAAALLVSGCASLGGGGSATNDALAKILTDPGCAHHDEINAIVGAAGIPASVQVKAVRDCPARPVE